MARMQRSLFAQLNALAEEISQGGVKTANEKTAGPVPADPGGYQGQSSHPSVSVDNEVQDAPEGARASEYESDIKEQQGATAVDNAPEMSQEGRQDDVQTNINTSVAATGEDPAAEKDFKGTKDDPGTSHPAKTNDGEKYSSASFKTARDKCSHLGNDILANLINFGSRPLTAKKAEEGEDEEDSHDTHESDDLKGDQHKLDVDNDGKIDGADLAALRNGADSDDKEAAYAAGYELAAALGVEKTAAEASVREVCANAIREADEMADLLIGCLSAKNAGADVMEDGAEGEDHSAPEDMMSGAGDAPPPEAGLADAVSEMPEEAALGGEMGGEMDGEPTEDEAVQELAMALEELGIPPEALLEAAMAEEGGAGPEMADAAPKMAAAKDLNNIGRAVVNFKRAGRFQVKEARTKRSRQLRDDMKQHILELINR